MIIFDLDGTLALDHHRSHYLQGDVKYWDEYFNACVHDEPNKPILDLLQVYHAAGREVGIFTGRSDSVLNQTVEWLDRLAVPELDCFYMRQAGDRTQDDVLKLQWAKELESRGKTIDLIFEDRQRVVDMWRREGYTCCQVAPGDF